MDRSSCKLQALIETFSETHQLSHEIHWIASPDFKSAEYISPAFDKIWGRPRENVLRDNRICDSYVLPDDLKNHHPILEMVKRIKQEGPKAYYDEIYRIIRPDGSIRWILDRGHPLFDKNDEYIGVTGVASDITAMKICEQLAIDPNQIFPYESNHQRYYLRGRYQNIYLTSREAECAFFLLQGKTAKNIAIILHLSFRTIEDMLSKIKFKLGVNYRSDLCQALIEGDFIRSLNS